MTTLPTVLLSGCVENILIKYIQTDSPVTKVKFGAKSYKDVLMTGGNCCDCFRISI